MSESDTTKETELLSQLEDLKQRRASARAEKNPSEDLVWELSNQIPTPVEITASSHTIEPLYS